MPETLSVQAALEAAKQQFRIAERTVAILQAAADVESLASTLPGQQDTFTRLKAKAEAELKEAEQKRDGANAAATKAVEDYERLRAELKGERARAEQVAKVELERLRAEADQDQRRIREATAAARTEHEALVAKLERDRAELETKVAEVEAQRAKLLKSLAG